MLLLIAGKAVMSQDSVEVLRLWLRRSHMSHKTDAMQPFGSVLERQRWTTRSNGQAPLLRSVETSQLFVPKCRAWPDFRQATCSPVAASE